MLLKTSEDILNYFTLTTSRLSLKPVELNMLPLLAKLYGCSHTMRYIAAPFSYRQTETMLKTMLQKQQQQQCDSLILLLQDKNSLIDYGISGILNIDFINKKAEIGVMLLPKGYGLGVAVEAATAIIAKLTTLGIETIFMQINPANTAAIRGAERLGFIAATSSQYIYRQVS
jgi:RimJ/RimL family protein N-acetyltransferase